MKGNSNLYQKWGLGQLCALVCSTTRLLKLFMTCCGQASTPTTNRTKRRMAEPSEVSWRQRFCESGKEPSALKPFVPSEPLTAFSSCGQRVSPPNQSQKCCFPQHVCQGGYDMWVCENCSCWWLSWLSVSEQLCG